MNKIETAKILACLKVAYPAAYNDVNIEDTVDLWANMFANENYDQVSKAVYSLIEKRKSTFPPSIGEVKAEIVKDNPKDVGDLNRRPYPQSFINTIKKFLAEEEAAGRWHRREDIPS